MRTLAALLFLLLAPGLTEAEDAPKKPKLSTPPPGIRWARDFDAALAQAARAGQPVFLAVNALENESANNMLAAQAYPSKAWGEASRAYVALVCNPNEHRTGDAPACGRYEGCECPTHQKALRWFLARFGEELISPQHVILEPDGDVAFRKEYYTGVVGPDLLDLYLSHVSPKLAYGQAASRRRARIQSLAKVPLEALPAQAATWLASKDGLSAAGLVNVHDDSFDKARRAAVIRALGKTPALQVPVLALPAEERVLFPDDEREETLLWVETLLAADRTYGVWAATRVLVNTEDETLREAVLRLWAGKAEGAVALADIPAGERPAAYEALLLIRDPRALVERAPQDWITGREAEIRRARALAEQEVFLPSGALRAALARPVPGVLRRRILDANLEGIRAHQADLVKLVREAPWLRVRIAAALRLLELREAAGGAVLTVLQQGTLDPIEGPETRRRVIALLGEDPGQNPAEWKRILNAFVMGGAK